MNRRTLILPVLATTLATLAFTAAPALAAGPPEAPETTGSKSVTASSAVLEGVLNPHVGVATKAGWYFAYTTELACGVAPTFAPAFPPGAAEETVKAKHEEIEVTGLEPNREYTFCMVATSEEGAQATQSVAEPKFTTAKLPPAVTEGSESFTERKAVSVRLNATVNPENETSIKCEFQYGQATVTEGEVECEGAPIGGGEVGVTAAVPGLTAGKTYKYRVLLETESGTKEGKEESFTAALPPETPSGEAVEPASITANTANVKGIINAANEGEKGSYRFVYSPSATSCTESGLSAPETPEPYGTNAEEKAHTELKNLLPGTVYSFCLQATNEAGEPIEGVPVQFKTLPAAPEVSAPTTGTVGSGSAEVSAQLDPGGEPTSYQVQYVTDAAFAAHGFAEPSLAPSPAGEIPAVNHPETIHVTLSGLSPSTGYHYRFVAGNETGKEVTGAEATFTTAAAEGALPDNRAYELVSTGTSGEPFLPQFPQVPQGSLRGKFGKLTFQAAADGERVTYESEPGKSGGIGLETGSDQTLAQRTATGWQAQDITPGGDATSEPVFQAFSLELSTAILEEPSAGPRLAAGVTAGCRALDVSAWPAGHRTLTPLFTTNCGNPLVAGESSDGKHIIFQTTGALTPGSQAATEIPKEHGINEEWGEEYGNGCAYGCNLYESGEGGLTLVNQIEEHGVLHQVPNATLGGYRRESHGIPDFSHAVSADGSRVFWTDTAPDGEGNPVEEVYVLKDGTREVKVSGAHAEYWTATPDGRYAYYVEEEGFYEPYGGFHEPYGRLYRFDTETGTSLALTPAGPGGVIGVIGTNTTGADGEYLYFVATGGIPVFGSGVSGEPNVYVIHDGVTSLVATAFGEDAAIWAADRGIGKRVAPWIGALGLRQTQVSPDGTHLVFQTRAAPTAFNSEGAVEVFDYSAPDGKLVCVSCDAAGTPIPETERTNGMLTVSAENETYTHRWMSADGNRVFFNTSQSLVPEDRNGVEDVYEWEREGEGSCAVKSPASPVGGCQFLLSGGQSPAASFFVDADETGDNVFFVHVGVLGVVQANAGHLELYDARVDGGFPPSSAGCSGAACQGTVPLGASGTSAAPSSALFTGVGNYPPVLAKPVVVVTRQQRLAKALAACRRERVGRRKRVACERAARKRYGPPAKKTARKASRDRRVGR